MLSRESRTLGLTTGRAPFIEDARDAGQLYIEQPFELYSGENHQCWRRLYARMRPRWEKYANEHFLAGLESLHLPADHVPRLADVNGFLKRLTGFEAKAVSGYVPAYSFFECLKNRQFPTTVTIRASDELDYLPEPDIFHDVAGHVPMHTDPHFAETLVRFGECAVKAPQLVVGIPDDAERAHVLTSMIKAMARFFWFTIEFGLMRSRNGIKAYGSGLLSSYGEIAHAIDSPAVQRYPIQLEWAINQAFEIDHYQPLLFVADSFDQLFNLMDKLEQWMKEGKLSHVAPGEPHINESDLKSFLGAVSRA